MLSWGKSQIRVQYISNMLFNWSMFCLGSVWILYCLTFLWIPSLYAWLMINVSESTFVLKIGAHSEGLHDWSGHCAQLTSPVVRTCFPYKFSAVKSYPSTNYVQLCSSENVTQKVFFLEYYPPSLSLACQKFMGIIPTLLLIPSVFSLSVQLSPTAFPSWWNPTAILVLRTSSSATFSAQGNPLNIPGEAQCIPPHSYKNLLVVHLRKGGVSVSRKQFRDMHLLTVIWQWSEDLWD